MFAGHVGAAQAIGRSERRIYMGMFVLATLLFDFVLWLFALLGWEFVTIAVVCSRVYWLARHSNKP